MNNVAKMKQCDILVVGSSLEGCVAAVTAARKGKTVYLMEKSGSLGGIASNGLAAFLPPCKEEAAKAVRAELLERLNCADTENGAVYPDQLLKLSLGQWLRDAGVTWWTHVFVSEPIVEDGKVVGMRANGKTEPFEIRAGLVIDATDALDTAGLAGLAQTAFSGKVSVTVKANRFEPDALPLENVVEMGACLKAEMTVPFEQEIGGMKMKTEKIGVIIRRDCGEILLSGLTCEMEDCAALTVSAAQMRLRRFAYALRDHLRQNVAGMQMLNIIHVAPKLNCYGMRQVENPPCGLKILNNDGLAYCAGRAIEKGIEAAS